MATRTFTESSEDFLNPERGFYVGLNLRSGQGAAAVRASGHSLALAIVRLDDYRTKSLDSAILADIRAGFADARAHGIKVILRFSYNASFTADASRDRILQHIGQIAPILADNGDVLAVMQAGFIGAWGEWHGSTNGLENTPDRTAILKALLAAVPAHRAIQVRTPMFKAESFGSGALADGEAFAGTDRARIGHHNDCFLASDSDLGTYAAPVANWEAYVSQEGRFTPIGGETCKVNAPRSGCASAVAEMKARHWSFLNEEYHQDVLESWEDEGCLDEVKRSLGYRFVLAEVTHPEKATAGGELALDISVANRGFATPFNARKAYVVLTKGSERHVVEITGANADPRGWETGESVTVSARVQIPSEATAGTYRVSLWLPDAASSLRDDARYAVRLANDGVWDEETGENILIPELPVDAAPTKVARR